MSRPPKDPLRPLAEEGRADLIETSRSFSEPASHAARAKAMTATPFLAVIVLTFNEERNIAACLDTLTWADELIVLDSFSTDRTVEIARAKGARVERHTFTNWAAQRTAAMALTKLPWVFFVDADERATPELAAEVQQVVQSDEYAGYWAPRRNIIFGKHIRHTGWSPDYQPRLLNVARCRWDPAHPVHELVIFDGKDGHLSNTLTHYNYDTISQFVTKQEFYTDIAAGQLFSEDKRARLRSFIGQPAREFVRRFISLQGYRDGPHGLLLSILLAYYAFRTYVKLWRLARMKTL
jgi:(heptosyl)LPS beta-1,4-glucosyltransferase